MTTLNITKLFIEDARISTSKTHISVSFFNDHSDFLCSDTNWRCFRYKNFLVCCYIDPDLDLDHYDINSFSRKILSKGELFMSIGNSRINHPLRQLIIKGPVVANVCVDTLDSFEFYSSDSAVVEILGNDMNLRIKEKSSSITRISGTVSRVVVEILESSCILDMSGCRVSPNGDLFVSIDATGKFLVDPNINRILNAADSFFRPVPTTRQLYVKRSIQVPADPDVPVSSPPEDRTCLLCCENLANAHFDPCGHDLGCLRCAERIRREEYSNFTCPWCRKEIEKVVHVPFPARSRAKRQRVY